MKTFLQAISSGALASLKELFLSDNQIGDLGMIAFADAIKPTDEIPMGGRAPNNLRLTHERPSVPPKTQRIWNPGGAPRPNPLSFRRYGWPFKSYRGVKIPNFPKSGAVIGSTTLGSLASLKVLSFRGNQIGDSGMIAFADAIKPTDEIPMGALASLTKLDLDNNKIGDEGIKAFSTALSSGALASLEVLLLYDNQIGDKGMKAFSTAISSGALASLEALGLGGNHIDDEGMKAFSTALSSRGALPSLKRLDLGDNRIGDNGMNAFSNALSRGALTSLHSLYIRHTPVHPELKVVCNDRYIDIFTHV